MTAPTRDQLAKASFELEQLAYLDPDLFHQVAAILDRAEYVRAELAHHKTQAGHRRSSEVAPVGVGAASSVEAQYAGHSTPKRMHPTDPMVRAAQTARRSMISTLGNATYHLERAAEGIGYPRRNTPEQWRVG